MSQYGLAKTDEFVLNEATIMLTSSMTSVLGLTEADSIGLAKNMVLNSQTEETNLTQGVANTIVDSVRTGNNVTGSFDMYEFTPVNMLRALGGDTSGIVSSISDNYVLDTAIAGTETSIDITDAGDNSGDFLTGQWIKITDLNTPNKTFVTKLTGDATHAAGVTTLPIAGTSAIPTGLAFTVALGRVSRVNVAAGAQKVEQTVFSMKAITQDRGGNQMIFILPKIKLTGGLNFNLGTGEHRSSQVGFTVYDLVSTDPLYDMLDEDHNNASFLILK